MKKTFALVLPTLIPSWRFFKAIEPSPRVQWGCVGSRGGQVEHWNEFRPRPRSVTPLHMLAHLFWNPRWNETLFLVSCAERIQQEPTDHSINEIRTRILSEIEPSDAFMRFRLVFVHREAARLTQEVVFMSEAFPTSGPQA